MTKVNAGRNTSAIGKRPSSIKVSEDGNFKGTQPEINFTGDVTVTNDIPNNKLNVNVTGGSSGGGTWGSITGTLSDQTDLNTALGLKAPLASPAFTGTPTAPTAAAGTNTTQLATTEFVQTELYNIYLSET